jgi:2-amino-4-hydroxy-6-hydroxymethyldihydropteridine diphosphokinase
MQKAYVSIGSNIERDHHIKAGMEALQNLFGELHASPVYESASVGFDGDNFYNLVVGFETDMDPVALVDVCHEIEKKYDRRRDANRFSARTLDIDVLLLGDAIFENEGISIPRKEITEYAFVLQPLADIVGENYHPVLGKTYSQLWMEFDKGEQSLWQINSNQTGV